MLRRKKKAALLAAQEEAARVALAEQAKLPPPERAFFDMLLHALSGGLHELAHSAKAPPWDDLPLKCTQARGTVAYAQALLRLEAFDELEDAPEELPVVLNIAENQLRREFLYAGTALRRPPDEALRGVVVPREVTAFLLEEMMACCLRCAPEGRQLHIGAKQIGDSLLLSMRSEGYVPQLPPLIPPLDDEAPGGLDYGFAMCRRVAALAGWAFRWDADEAGVRMFLDIRL